MGHIFISYSHKDKKYVEKLEKKLLEEGFNVWIDHRTNFIGDWPKERKEAVKACTALIVVMSEKAQESEWVEKEIQLGEKYKKSIFPVLLSGNYWFSLAHIQYEDISKFSLPSDEFYVDLADAINANTKKNSSQKMIFGFVGGVVILFLMISILYFDVIPLKTVHPLSGDVIKTETPLPPTETRNLVGVPTQTPCPRDTSNHQVGDTWLRLIDNMNMSYIPAGEFRMGSELQEERPVHKVCLVAFWMDQTEISNSQFRIFSEATGYRTDAEKKGYSDVFGLGQSTSGANWEHPLGLSSSIVGLDNYPVIHISWNDARMYCEWAGARLPTEAEWEKAARGGIEGANYAWGNNFGSGNANFCDVNCQYSGADKSVDDGYAQASPVAQFPPNGYGLYDMAGNLWEWVASLYGDYPYRVDDGRENLSMEGDRVVRGGSWIDDKNYLRSSVRYRRPVSVTDNITGFRCVRSLQYEE